jgi:FtsH-binding integral membrane protein
MIWIKFNWLKLLAILAVLGAFGFAMKEIVVPFAYYQFMNWIVVGAGLVTAQQASMRGKSFTMWLFILVAVVFNPIAPMYFNQFVWNIADLATAVLFLISFMTLSPKKS